MTRTVVSLTALLLSIVLLVSGNAFLTTLLGLQLSSASYATSTIGAILVCYSVGFVVGTLQVHHVIGRVGHIRAFSVFAALAAVSCLAHPIWLNEYFWAALRAITGFSIAGLLVIIESWFSSRATNSNRAALFAVYQIVFYLAGAGGQLLINVGDPDSFLPFTIAAVLLTLALIPLALTRMEAPVVESAERIPFLTLWNEASTAVAAAVVCGIMIGGFYNLGPVYATEIGLERGQTSLFMACAIVSAMLLAWPIGYICDRNDRRRVLLGMSVATVVSAVLVTLVGGLSFIALLICVGAFTGLAAALYPIGVAIANDRLEHHRITAASATLLLSYGVGSVLGPLVLSGTMSLLGANGFFWGAAVILIGLAGYIAWRISATDDIPVEAQEHYIAAPPEISVLAEIDPRNTDFSGYEASEGVEEVSESSAGQVDDDLQSARRRPD